MLGCKEKYHCILLMTVRGEWMETLFHYEVLQLQNAYFVSLILKHILTVREREKHLIQRFKQSSLTNCKETIIQNLVTYDLL